MAPVKELGGGGEERKETAFPSFPSPPPTFIFLALVSFLARPKSRIPFLGLSLLRNQTETLAMQAIMEGALMLNEICHLGMVRFYIIVL